MENIALAISSLLHAALRHAQDVEDNTEAADVIARQFSALYASVESYEDFGAQLETGSYERESRF